MRRVDKLITQIRKQTENTDFSSTTGIDNSEFIQYINDAQNRLQSLILQQHPSLFHKETIFNVAPGQEAYNIPSDAFLFNKVELVEYSTTGRSDDYYPLRLISMKNRNTNVDGHPQYYIRKSGKLLLSPLPTTSAAKIRLTYVKRIDELDLRRAVVLTSTISNNQISSLALDVSGNPPIDSEALDGEDYICIVDRDGTLLSRNIPIDSINASGVVTVSSGFLLQDGETIPAGSYVVGGVDKTTHSELPRAAERYLIAYCAWKILVRDSSVDNAEQSQELVLMERDLIDSFADIEEDVQLIPILDTWDNDGYL